MQRALVRADDDGLNLAPRSCDARRPQRGAGARDTRPERGAAILCAFKDPERGADRGGEQGRGRGRENEIAAAVHEKLPQRARQAEERAREPQGLAASVQRDDVLAPLELMRKPASARPIDARRMRLVDDEESVIALGERGERCEWGAVAVHAVKAFNDDPEPPGARMRVERRFEGDGVIVADSQRLCAREPHALMRAGVNEFVIENEIAALRQRRQQRFIGRKSRADEERALCAEEARRFFFERLMLGMIAAQEPRAAGAERDATRKRRRGGPAVFGGLGEAEIVVGGEVEPAARAERAKAVAVAQGGEIGEVGGEEMLGGRGHVSALSVMVKTPTECGAPSLSHH